MPQNNELDVEVTKGVNSERIHAWFIEVNPKAECYNDFKAIVEQLTNCKYAYICHDKDVEDDGTLKHAHYHLALYFKNARTFSSMKNTFKGAHLEEASILYRCVRYLCHLDHKNKHQYPSNDIITNDDDWTQNLLSRKVYPKLDEDVILNDLLEMYRAGRYFHAMLYFYMTYGNEQTKKYRQMIQDLLNSREGLEYAMNSIALQPEEVRFDEND